jgi:putative (di)nucleoside polyphosphate hydrolase
MKAAFYRPCVGIMLFNQDGLVFVGKRRQSMPQDPVDEVYVWQMPQGGIDPHEKPYDAALRELYEETNICSVSLIKEAPDWYSYDVPSTIAGRAWRSRYKGQIQKWFAFRFEGDESEINIHSPAGGQHKPEFDDWRWEPMDALPALIIPFKRQVYLDVIAYFSGVETLKS